MRRKFRSDQEPVKKRLQRHRVNRLDDLAGGSSRQLYFGSLRFEAVGRFRRRFLLEYVFGLENQ